MVWLLILLAACTVAQELTQLSHQMQLGEGPLWSQDEQALYWVDIDGKDVWRYHPESENITTCHIYDGRVSVIVPIKDRRNVFAIGVEDKVRMLKWEGRNESVSDTETIIASVPSPDGGRLNDGKVDSRGRFWLGTIGRETNKKVEANKAAFFKLGCINGSLEAILQVEDITVSNGIAWTSDDRTMYYIDSPTRRIDAFNFEPNEGLISQRRTIFRLDTYNISGVPDGMTIDTEGNLWVGLYGGEAVIVVDPRNGRLLRTYPIPGVPNVTSVAWGGPQYDVLFITTAQNGEGKGGQLYKLTNTGAKGGPANRFIIPQCNN